MATEIKMPQLGLTMEEGTVERWLKQEGDPVREGEPILEITTDKLTNEVAAESSGVLLKIVASQGTDVKVKGTLGWIGEAGEAIPAGTEAETPEPVVSVIPTVTEDRPAERKLRISPLARKIALERGLDTAKITGTGPGGRIIRRDVLAAGEAAPVREAAPVQRDSRPAVSAAAGTFPVKELELMEGDTAEKLGGMRKVVAQRMYTSAVEIPTVTQTVKVDVTKLTEFRKKINTGRDQTFSINDFVLKAVAKALRHHPQILVSLDGERIIRRRHVNLGMAVALEEGLIVPVIRDADQLSLEELSQRARDLALRARSNQLGGEEYKGSTFTVSNLGMYGVESFTPIINQPDAAILGVNCIQTELALTEGGCVEQRQVMRISLTYDHRLMDGSVAAKFEMDVRDLLQEPMDILL